MILFSQTITSRLQYIADFIGKEISGQSFAITDDIAAYTYYSGPKINYSIKRIANDEFWIKPHALLFQNNIQEQNIDCFEVNGHKAFFKTEGDLTFDIFAASFYLLSRYEEYLPHQKDEYGRYAYQNSLAFKQKFLDQPLINIWLSEFCLSLQAKNSKFKIQNSKFAFLPTYDIDMAWSYKNKGWRRNIGGAIRSILKADWRQLKERINVFRGKQKDPFEAYEWMDQLHDQYKLKPHYFFLVAGEKGKYDKNIFPGNKMMKTLIHDHAAKYPIGIHPSWQSGDNASLLQDEIKTLSSITGSVIQSSRQHYIRFTLPETFRKLIDNRIKFDFSMGYGSINGFRTSVASSFYWYDLPNEKQTDLLLFPFCFMDANSFYEQKFSAQQALDEMRYYYKTIKSVNGTLVMIWHNNFLGTDRSFKGWKEIYEQFIKEITV